MGKYKTLSKFSCLALLALAIVWPGIWARQADSAISEAVTPLSPTVKHQDLDKAIGLWDELLELVPDYESASIYRSQAVELRNKLTKLN